MTEGECKLCKETKPLVRKSHIYPHFMYKNFFDENHKIAVVNMKFTEKKMLPTGFYERNILCQNCENKILSRYESYASQYFFTKNPGVIFKVSNVGKDCYSVSIKNIDYKCFKLFLLSLLWRASISKHEFFKRIKLGPYEEKIRQMLLNGDPGEEDEFMTYVVFAKNKYLPLKMVVDPVKLKINSNTCYVMFISGVFYHINISKYNISDFYYKGALAKDNTMEAALVTGSMAEEYLDGYCRSKLRLRNPMDFSLINFE